MKEWKAAEKETQKMTRDGAISVNMVTGEASRVSDRALEQDYSPSGDSAAFVHSAAERLDDRALRLKTLGNAVCPPQAYPIFRYIAMIENGTCGDFCPYGKEGDCL